jgi:hypothetical protein
VLKRVTELLGRCGSEASVLPPTELYNEGWMLRLILDWFDRNRDLPHALSFLPEARWYSEALLPSRFLPQQRGDKRAESFTHADGVVGHFTIAPGESGEAKLATDTRQFLVTEAKLASGLSSGTKNAPSFDQAARSVACIAHMVGLSGVEPKGLDRLAFYVLAPQGQIDASVFGDLVTKDSILKKVRARVAQYQGPWDSWFRDTFQPVLERIEVGLLSWESILDCLSINPETSEIREFYELCRRFNSQHEYSFPPD